MPNSLRSVDRRAWVSAVCAGASTVPGLAAVAFALQRYQAELGQIVYGAGGRFLPVFALCVLFSLSLGMLGCILGLSTLYHRRNTRPLRSWIGFVLGGGVVTMDVVLLMAFVMLRLEKPA